MIAGKLEGQGTHLELMAQRGWYARMFELQQDEADATLVAEET